MLFVTYNSAYTENNRVCFFLPCLGYLPSQGFWKKPIFQVRCSYPCSKALHDGHICYVHNLLCEATNRMSWAAGKIGGDAVYIGTAFQSGTDARKVIEIHDLNSSTCLEKPSLFWAETFSKVSYRISKHSFFCFFFFPLSLSRAIFAEDFGSGSACSLPFLPFFPIKYRVMF